MIKNPPLKRSLAAVPSFDETRAQSIATSLLKNVTDVIIIDDGSCVPIKAEPPVRVHRFNENRGYGDAIQIAITIAREEHLDSLIFVDGDGQHDLAYVMPLLELLQNFDVAIGNRLHPESPIRGLPQPTERRQANDLFRRTLRNLHPQIHLGDFFSGFIAFRVKNIPLQLDLRGTRYASPARMWPCIAGANLRVTEIPIPCIYLTESNKFVRQYDSMTELGGRLVDEFTTSSQQFLGLSRETIRTALHDELRSGRYKSILNWMEPIFRKGAK